MRLSGFWYEIDSLLTFAHCCRRFMSTDNRFSLFFIHVSVQTANKCAFVDVSCRQTTDFLFLLFRCLYRQRINVHLWTFHVDRQLKFSFFYSVHCTRSKLVICFYSCQDCFYSHTARCLFSQTCFYSVL